MPRVRLSTTVDRDLLDRARSTVGAITDASLVDTALRALLDRRRAAEIDEAYGSAYREHPVGLLVERIGRVSDLRMHEMCAALQVATASA
jgi:hypothetical protein